MTEAFSEWIIRWRWAIIAGTLLIVLAAAGGAGRLVFIDNYHVFFSKENPDLRAFETIENVYTKNDNVLFLVAPKDGRVFTRETLSNIEWLTREAWKIPFSTPMTRRGSFSTTLLNSLRTSKSYCSDALPKLITAQRDHRIHFRRPPRRVITSQQSHQRQ